jgi:pimeloyl-ACP methyl ester carboxylesterase
MPFLQDEGLRTGTQLIAVDLPGYGGSDSFDKYSSTNVMEALSTFVLGMKEQHLQHGGKTVIVAHDWGCVLACRLASEAGGLADRYIVSNAFHVRLQAS